MSAVAHIIEGFGIQPGTALAAEITKQLSAAEALALQKSRLTPDELVGCTTLLLVSRGGNARAAFVALGSLLSVYGTCNIDGVFVCFGKKAPPTDLQGPFEFVIEGSCVRVYQLKQLVWHCCDTDE